MRVLFCPKNNKNRVFCIINPVFVSYKIFEKILPNNSKKLLFFTFSFNSKSTVLYNLLSM